MNLYEYILCVIIYVNIYLYIFLYEKFFPSRNKKLIAVRKIHLSLIRRKIIISTDYIRNE